MLYGASRVSARAALAIQHLFTSILALGWLTEGYVTARSIRPDPGGHAGANGPEMVYANT